MHCVAWLRSLAAVLLLAGGLRAANADGVVRIDLIGTGGPELTADRTGAATLIRAHGEAFLFDAGRGALQGIYRSGVGAQSVTKIFLTHLHNDHIEGLPPLWITPWFLMNRKQRLEVWGPPGTRNMIDGMRKMFAHDVEQRANARFHREDLDITVHETEAGVIYDGPKVQIVAVPAEHHEGNPAFAYRFQSQGKVILLTGDTTLTDSLTRAATGADIVISNVAAGTEALERGGTIDAVLNKLMRPEQAAQLFHAARPRLAIYSHIVKKQLPGIRGDAHILQRTRQAGFKGPLVMGTDGMRIVLDAKAKILPAPPLRSLPEVDGAGFTF